MSNSMKKSTSPEALRATADAACARWRELDAKAQAIQADNQAFARLHPIPHGTWATTGRLARASEQALQHLQRELRFTEAQALAAAAEREAVTALNVAEAAEGLADIRLRDLPSLRSDLVVLVAEQDAARAALDAATKRVTARLDDVTKGDMLVAKRRGENGQPFAPSGFVAIAGSSLVAAVDAALTLPAKALPHAAWIAGLKNQITNCAATLERARIEAAEAAKEKENDRIWRDRQLKIEQNAIHAQERARNEQAERDAAERQALADAYLGAR